MKFITVAFPIVQQAFAFGTLQEAFTITVTKPDGTSDSAVTETIPFTFPTAYDHGDYTVTVSNNGVSQSASITINPDIVMLNVSGGPLVLTLSDSLPA